MAEIVKNIIDVRNKGTINVYAVCYKQRGKSENAAVALPGNLNFELRSNFCENVIRYKDAQERAFNPTSDGLENNTYEYIPHCLMMQITIVIMKANRKYHVQICLFAHWIIIISDIIFVLSKEIIQINFLRENIFL